MGVLLEHDDLVLFPPRQHKGPRPHRMLPHLVLPPSLVRGRRHLQEPHPFRGDHRQQGHARMFEGKFDRAGIDGFHGLDHAVVGGVEGFFLTTSASKSVPSWNFTPLRKWNT